MNRVMQILTALCFAIGVLACTASGGMFDPALPQAKDYAPPGGADKGQATNSTPLTLNACVKIAVSGNPAAAAAKEGVAAAEQYVEAAAGSYYPTVSISAAYRRWRTHAFMPSGLILPTAEPLSTIGPVNDWPAGVKASWMLFDSGERRSRLIAAKSRAGAAEAETDAIMQDIVLNVHKAFFSLVSAQQMLAVSETNVVRTTRHLENVTKKQTAGSAVEADVLRVQTQVADSKLALVRCQSLVRLARGNLNAAMGLPVELDTEIKSTGLPMVSPDGIDMNDSFDAATEARPEVLARLYGVASARSSIAAVKSELGPRLRLDAAYGYRDDTFSPEDVDWSVGVAIEIPLFSGFSSSYKLSAAKHELASQESATRGTILAIRQEVWASWQKLKENREALSASEALLKDARESMRSTQQRFDAGACTPTDLLDVQTTLARAESSLVQARWDYHAAKSTFDRATGAIVVPRE